MRKVFLIILALLFILQGCAIRQEPQFSDIRNIHSAIGENIICFGNSLTAGEGAEEGKDFPSILREKLGIPVINAGHNGDTTETALDRLDRALEQNPKIVIVELGANDFLTSFKGGWKEADISDVKAFQNLRIIVNKIQNMGAVVVIAGITLNSKYTRGYKDLAKETGSVLIPDILEGIYNDRKLMSLDNRHPNSAGYQKMSEIFIGVLNPLLEEMSR